MVATVATSTMAVKPAKACGGCFHEPLATESTVVTGHRMAVSISPSKFVLWDQIQYAGDPSEFSWVLPIKPGATIEVASPAFFEVLEAATATVAQQPVEGCRTQNNDSGISCAASLSTEDSDRGDVGGFNDGVQVVSEATVGPYETVTLSATEPDALRRWLSDNDFVLPDDVAPIVDAYVDEGFDFIALKLAPNSGTNQMTPVRVESPGGGVTLPLRMVAAGTGARVDLVLYVIGEGRYRPRGYEEAALVGGLVTWDFRDDSSDVGELRRSAFEKGDTWLTTFARRRALLAPLDDQLGPFPLDTGADSPAETIVGAYFATGEVGRDLSPQGCAQTSRAHAESHGRVVDNCDEEGSCVPLDGGLEISSSDFVCGELDDVAVALEGLHPADVWVTRLETQLPRERLDADLVLEASPQQNEVGNRFVAGLSVNNCWDRDAAAAVPQLLPLDGPRLPPGTLGWMLTAGVALALSMRRPRRRVRLART